jgi:predicted O-methyltransferase YrrM
MSTELKLKFSSDWFSSNIPVWKTLLSGFKGTSIEALEVGSYEGRSAIWLVENVLTNKDSKLYCIDTFLGSSEHTKDQKENLMERFLNNIKASNIKDKIQIYQGFSGDVLSSLRSSSFEKFHIMYIDGAHETPNVLEDAILAWPLLKVSGILIFDDYGSASVKQGVDAFVSCYQPKLKVLHTGWQLALQKTLT